MKPTHYLLIAGALVPLALFVAGQPEAAEMLRRLPVQVADGAPVPLAQLAEVAQTQPLEVRKDPNSGGTEAEIQAQVAVLSGLFEVIRALGLYNSAWALILSYTIFTLPFTVWVLTTFMGQLPHELEEAAIMDGASPWVTLTRVLLPLLWPALVTTGLLAFIAAWNEFLFALTFTLTDTQRTVPVAIALISGGSPHELPWGLLMAASVLVTVPLVILVLIFQRRIVSGLTAGALKG